MADFAIILAAALVGGLAAFRLRVPAVLGYLVAGVVIGPYSLRLVHDIQLIQTLAAVGVVLLMFALGMEFSLGDLKRVGKVGLGGGTAQILVTAGFGLVVASIFFKWPAQDAIFFGFLISLSSTMVVLKILIERGETGALHGRIMIAILLLQDLAVLPLMVVLPALGQPPGKVLPALGLSLANAALFLSVITLIGSWAIPGLLGRMAGPRSRELFLITILAISLGAAFATSFFGVSQAFGAFAAGMLVSRSHFAHQALADVVPFRNVFAALFFMTLGMLANPQFVTQNLAQVIAVALLIIAGKFVISGLIARRFGYGIKTVLLVGAGLTQVGEFSFVLGQAGRDAGVISEYLYSLILPSALLTMLFTPLAFKVADLAHTRLSASKRFAPFLRFGGDKQLSGVTEPPLSNHVVICGHGRTGSNLAHILSRYAIPYVVVELNPQVIEELRSRGIPCVYGDAGSSHILSLAHVDRARVLALTCPDPMSQATAATYAKRVNAGIDIIARLAEHDVAPALRATGVSEMVEPEFEASLEFVRHILRYFGVAGPEVEDIVCPFLREREATETEAEPEIQPKR